VILVVDDEPWFVAPLTQALVDAGFKIQLVCTPNECMEVVASGECIEAILLDVMLPPGSLDLAETAHGFDTGLVLLRMIRERLPHTPIILHSVRNDFRVPDTPGALTLVLPKSNTSLASLVQFVRKIVDSQKEATG
jgi:CheY-like chemotaxis protein